MKKNKTAELFLALLILIVMSAGILILQNGMEKLQSVKQESVYVPETRDLYNNYGLKNDQSLSKTKILETQDQVIYTDRIFNINQISEENISYAADIMKALQKKSGKATYYTKYEAGPALLLCFLQCANRPDSVPAPPQFFRRTHEWAEVHGH